MNQAGIKVLIQAGLSGHPQTYHMLHFDDKDCALGVLHLSMHATRKEALRCCESRGGFQKCFFRTLARYEISTLETARVTRLNDYDHLDFIGIARKLEEQTEK